MFDAPPNLAAYAFSPPPNLADAAPERVTAVEFAQRLGLTLPAITRAVSEGRVVRDLDGLFAWPQERDRYLAVTSLPPDRVSDIMGTAAGGYQAARTRITELRAEQAALALAKSRGELISITEAQRVAGEVLGALKDALESLPVKLSPELARARDMATCQQILTRAISDALNTAVETLNATSYASE